MKQFFIDLFPREFRTNTAHVRALLLGTLYLVTLLAQLFTFEKFGGVLEDLAFPGGEVTVVILTWLLPLLGLLSLPLLLSMRMGDRLYTVSRTAVVALPLVWLCVAVWSNCIVPTAGNSGLFGATLALPVGVWQILLSLLWVWAAILTVRNTPRR